MRIAACVEYAGDAFEGWQSQRHGRTVQDVFEKAVTAIAGHAVRVHCAGRTDTGVHATAQIVHFDAFFDRPLNAWVRGVNGYLPARVAVRWAVEVDEKFHARFCAHARRYRYVLYNASVRPALLGGRVGWFHVPLDEARMARAAASLVGEHDFSAFRAADCQAASAVKTMHDIRVQRTGAFVVFDFYANAFLHHMVRNLVGTLVQVGKGAQPESWVGEVLAERNRSRSGATFPPDGLYLCGVEYPPNWPLPNDGRIIAIPSLLSV